MSEKIAVDIIREEQKKQGEMLLAISNSLDTINESVNRLWLYNATKEKKDEIVDNDIKPDISKLCTEIHFNDTTGGSKHKWSVCNMPVIGKGCVFNIHVGRHKEMILDILLPNPDIEYICVAVVFKSGKQRHILLVNLPLENGLCNHVSSLINTPENNNGCHVDDITNLYIISVQGDNDLLVHFSNDDITPFKMGDETVNDTIMRLIPTTFNAKSISNIYTNCKSDKYSENLLVCER